MICERISPSRADLYESCPLRYYSRYVLKNRGPSSTPLEIGLFAHKILEDYYDPESEKSFEECVDASKVENECTSFSAFREAVDMSRDEVLRHPKDSIVVLSTETEMEHDFEDGLCLYGRIDRIDYVDESAIRIVDYKSGFYVSSFADIREGHQANMYSLWAFNTPDFGELKKVYFSISYLRDGISKPVEITREDSEVYKDYLLYLIDQIQRNEDPQPRINNFCWNCEYRSNCSLYQDMIKTVFSESKMFKEFDPEAVEIEHLAEASRVLGNGASSLKKEKEVIDSWIVGIMRDRELKFSDAGDNKVTMASKRIVKNDFNTVYNLAQERGVSLSSVLSVKNNGLSSAFAGDDRALNEIELNQKVDSGRQYVSISKRKVKK